MELVAINYAMLTFCFAFINFFTIAKMDVTLKRIGKYIFYTLLWPYYIYRVETKGMEIWN